MTFSSPFWRRLWLDGKALALPMASYWAAVFAGLALFTGAVALVATGDLPDTLAILAGVWLGTVIGLALGQLLALLRLRAVWAIAIAVGFWMAVTFATAGGAYSFAVLAAGGPLMIIMFIALFVMPMFLATGHWSLSTHTGMLATFGPLMWFTAAILTTAQATGGAKAWFEGDKWAVWSVLTVPMLGAGIALVLLYLAGRELHRLHAWRFSPLGPDLPAGSATTVGLRSAGCGGLVVVFMLAIPLTVGTALVAPYFWRSQESEEGTEIDGNTDNQPASEQPEPAESPGGDGGKEAMEQASNAAQEAVRAFITMLMLLLFALAALLVFGPPLRRMLLLQYLRSPFWSVAPSRRIAQHWRLVEIALADAGLHRQQGDSATALAKRAAAEVALLDPESLTMAAEVADRVAFGVGIAHDDVMVARRAAEMTYQSVWDDLSEWARWKAMYRLL